MFVRLEDGYLNLKFERIGKSSQILKNIESLFSLDFIYIFVYRHRQLFILSCWPKTLDMDIMSTLKAIIILQTDGRRSLAQYYDDKLNPKQFERHLFAKTKAPKSKDEILVLDGVLVVHKFITDSHFYVVGGRNENPLVLDTVLNCLVEVIDALSSSSMSSGNTVLSNLSRIILALDEICDGGLILEVDSNLVLQRITATNEDSGESITQRGFKRLMGLWDVGQ